MAGRGHDREPRLDAQQRALLVALLVSLLAHHTFFSLLPAPHWRTPPRKRPVVVELYEPQAPPAGVLSPDAPLVPAPPVVAMVEANPPPPADETPAQRELRRRRDLDELRPPVIPPEIHRVPRPPEPTPEPQRRPPADAEQQPLNMHFVHLPPRTDESDAPPDHARFFAQRTQTVPEETRAAVTTLQGEEAPEAHAQARNDQQPAPNDGVNDGRPQIEQHDGSPEPDRHASHPTPPQPAHVAAAGGAPRGRPGTAQQPQPPPPAPQPQARPGGEDGNGAQSPVVAAAGVVTPPAPEGTMPAQQQDEQRVGRPGQGPEVPGGPPTIPVPAPAVASAGQHGENGSGGAGAAAGASTTTAPPQSLELDWTTFQDLFGEQLDRERQAFLERRQERRRMGGAIDRMNRATAQLENFTPDVRPGNQTALDTLYHPFAEYLTAFHRKLHPQWGDGFLVSLIAQPDDSPLNDMTLWVKLEIVVNGDGTIKKVTIVRSSGNTVYDVAAIDAVFQGEPYPAPPAALQSGDGRLYLRWSFYRNQSQCGVWNAEPFILPDPPSLHEPGAPSDTAPPPPPPANPG